MNYIKIINDFWRFRREKTVSSLQADLYFFLLNECNSRNWEQPFAMTNGAICASIGITEKTLFSARLELEKLNLISVIPGEKKSKSPQYSFTFYCKNSSIKNDLYCNDNWNNSSKNSSKNSSIHLSNIINNKQKTKTFVDKSTSGTDFFLEPKSKTKKNNIKPQPEIEFWQQLVDVWFEFYKKNVGNGIQPTFKGSAPKNLKNIIENLKQRSLQKNNPWTEEMAIFALTKFFELAFRIDWLKNNFLLQNLDRQFDKIVNQLSNGTSKNTTTATGLKQQLAAELLGNHGE